MTILEYAEDSTACIGCGQPIGASRLTKALKPGGRPHVACYSCGGQASAAQNGAGAPNHDAPMAEQIAYAMDRVRRGESVSEAGDQPHLEGDDLKSAVADELERLTAGGSAADAPSTTSYQIERHES